MSDVNYSSTLKVNTKGNLTSYNKVPSKNLIINWTSMMIIYLQKIFQDK